MKLLKLLYSAFIANGVYSIATGIYPPHKRFVIIVATLVAGLIAILDYKTQQALTRYIEKQGRRAGKAVEDTIDSITERSAPRVRSMGTVEYEPVGGVE